MQVIIPIFSKDFLFLIMPPSLNDSLCRVNQGGIAQYRIFCKQYNQSLFIAHQLLDQILCKDVKTLVISYLMELQFLPELKADQKTDHTYLYKSRTFLYRFTKMMQSTRDSKFDPTLRDYYFWIACFFNKIQSWKRQYFLNFYSDSIVISTDDSPDLACAKYRAYFFLSQKAVFLRVWSPTAGTLMPCFDIHYDSSTSMWIDSTFPHLSIPSDDLFQYIVSLLPYLSNFALELYVTLGGNRGALKLLDS
jgi:hypothetical protein